MNRTINQFVLVDIYGLFHPVPAEYTFFSSLLEYSPRYTTFWATKDSSMIEKIEIIQNVFFAKEL